MMHKPDDTPSRWSNPEKTDILTAEELFTKLNPQDGTLPQWAKILQ